MDFWYKYEIIDGETITEVGSYTNEYYLLQAIAQAHVGQTVKMIDWRPIDSQSSKWLSLLTGKKEIKSEDVEL